MRYDNSKYWDKQDNPVELFSGRKGGTCLEVWDKQEITTPSPVTPISLPVIPVMPMLPPVISAPNIQEVWVWLKWDSVLSENLYDIYRKIKGGSYNKIGTSGMPYYKDNIKYDTEYWWVVVSVNKYGTLSDFSNEATINVQSKPDTPKNLTVTIGDNHGS